MSKIAVTTHYGEDVYKGAKKWVWSDNKTLQIREQNGAFEKTIAEYPEKSVIKVGKLQEE